MVGGCSRTIVRVAAFFMVSLGLGTDGWGADSRRAGLMKTDGSGRFMCSRGDSSAMSTATKIVLATVGIAIVLVLATIANQALA